MIIMEHLSNTQIFHRNKLKLVHWILLKCPWTLQDQRYIICMVKVSWVSYFIGSPFESQATLWKVHKWSWSDSEQYKVKGTYILQVILNSTRSKVPIYFNLYPESQISVRFALRISIYHLLKYLTWSPGAWRSAWQDGKQWPHRTG